MSPQLQLQRPVSDPAAWWRRTCLVAGTRLVLSGDLPGDPDERAAHLQLWVDEGISHIIDVRVECNDEDAVFDLQPHLGYCWAGADDDGGDQPDEWFDAGVASALTALADPAATVLVHCHMGVNRGPSMGFAIMLATGWDPVEALDAIRAARPIAAVLYAEQALDWWHRRNTTPDAVAGRERRRVRRWLSTNTVDAGWVISRIRRAGMAW